MERIREMMIAMSIRMVPSLLICGVSLLAQPPVPRYEVRRATSRIVIDGKLDDKAWASAPVIEFIFPWESQTGAKQKTRARLLWDDDYLYVGYECDDTDIVALRGERDDPTYLDDAVELFVNPKPAQNTVYFGLEMNARAVLYDYLMVDSQYAFKRFNLEGVLLASFIRGSLNTRGDEDHGWSLEVAIPWVNFEELAKRPVPGTVWPANLNRWDGVEPNRRLSMWSDSGRAEPSPHGSARFGQLVFVAEAR
jgi:hypothetical protein